jgi:Ca2+-binding RTX toxin-like protein
MMRAALSRATTMHVNPTLAQGLQVLMASTSGQSASSSSISSKADQASSIVSLSSPTKRIGGQINAALFELSAKGAWRVLSEMNDAGQLQLKGGLNSTVEGGDGNDWMWGWSEKSYLSGGAGDDIIVAHSSSTLSGGAGNDYLDGGSGSILYGGTGDDFLEGVSSNLNGGAGDDLLHSWAGGELYGGTGNDTVGGGRGSVLNGGDGDDSLAAGEATLYGGAGNDRIKVGYGGYIEGGVGDDTINVIRSVRTYVTGGGTSQETWDSRVENHAVIGFKRGDGHDQITLEDPEVSATVELGPGFSPDQVTFKKIENAILVSFAGSDDTLTLSGEYANVLLAFEGGATMDLRNLELPQDEPA